MKKYIFIVCVLAVIFIASPAFTQAAALSQSQIDAIVLLLQSFGADQTAISNVQTSLSGGTPVATATTATSTTTTTATTTTAPYYNFTKNLKAGFTGDDVTALQNFLISKGFLTIPSGTAKGYFGYSTKSALVAYQKSIGILSTGYFGLLTRTYVNEDQDASSAESTSTATQTVAIGATPNIIFTANNVSDTLDIVENTSVTFSWSASDADSCSSSDGMSNWATSYRPTSGSAELKDPITVSRIYTITCRNSSGVSSSKSVRINVKEAQSIATSTITVTSPNGGEQWPKGTTQTIKWYDNTPVPICSVGASCAAPAKYYDIKLIPYYPPCTEKICPSYPYKLPYTIANKMLGFTYNWSVGKVVAEYFGDIATDGSYTIQVCQAGTTTCDSSDSYFKIVSGTSTNTPPVINAIPAIPTDIKVGESISFSWGATDADGDDLAWSTEWGDGTAGIGTTCPAVAIGSTTESYSQNKQGWSFNASHAWASAGTYSVKTTVKDCRGGSNEHIDKVIIGSISTTPSITVTSPNGGEMWPVGSTQTITWKASDFPTGSTVYIELRPYGDFSVGSNLAISPVTKIVTTSYVSGSYSWQVPSNIIPGQYIIEIYKADQYGNIDSNESAKDVSNAPFGIVAATTTTTTSACSSVTMNGVSYSLNPCSIAMSMVDGQGNKNFSTTIISSVANSSYSFYVQGYGEGLPTYGILGGSSGGAIGNTTINLYFNDNIFSADGNQSKIYTGYLIIRIYQSTATGYDNHDLNLGITLTVSPSALGAVSTTQMASSTTSSNTANILDAINKLIESFSK